MERAQAGGIVGPPQEILDGWLPFVALFVALFNEALARTPGEFTITSWYRDMIDNFLAGGAVESQHTLAIAADVAGSQDQLRDLQNSMRVVGLVTDLESDHLHTQLLPAGVLAAAGVVFPRPVVA